MDTDATDDIVIGSQAAGDLDGTYPNPSVKGLRTRPISSSAPGGGDVLKWNGAEWAPAPDNVTTGGGVNTTARISGDGAPGNELDIAQQSATTGQVLKWNGLNWSPADDEDKTQVLSLSNSVLSLSNGGGSVSLPFLNYSAGPGIDITGSVISNIGDKDPNDDVNNGDQAFGDLAGVFPGPQVVRIRGNAISVNSPNNDQILKFNNGQWEPALDEVVDDDSDPFNEIQTLTQAGNVITLSGGGGSATLPTLTAGTGISLTGTVNGTQINNTGDTNAFDDITTSTSAGGDLTGLFPNVIVSGINGIPVVTTQPTNGQILRYSAGQWIPGTNDDNDADPSNEIQFLTLSGSDLSITGGNSVQLPAPPVYTGGTGINVVGTTIFNTGDVDPTDDITIGSVAGGDLIGTYPNPTVDKIQGLKISDLTPSNGQILKWNGNQWAPSNDLINDGDTDSGNEFQNLTVTGNTLGITNGNNVNLPVYSPGAGISFSGSAPNTIINNDGDLNPNDDITNTTVAGGDLSGIYPDPKVVQIQGVPVSGTAPSGAGQVLKYSGTQWVPGEDLVEDGDTDDQNEIQTLSIGGNTITLSGGGGSVNLPLYTAGAGININNNVVTNIGDTDASDDITNTTLAGGDLSGTFPNPTVVSLQGNAVSAASPGTGQILKWNGQWSLATDNVNDADADASNELQDLSISSNGTILTISNTGSSVTLNEYNAGPGISVTGTSPNFLINNTGDTNAADDITTSTPAGGDLSGNFPSPSVVSVQGFPFSNTTPASGQVLKWNGTQWAPAADGNTSYSAGTGISISGGNVIDNTGDVDASDDITIGSAAGGDLSGIYPNPSVSALQGRSVSTNAPATGEILKWSGTQWVPNADDNNTYTAGSGIAISVGNQVSNTGDIDASDDITNTTSAGGDLAGTYPNPSVAALQGNAVSTTAPNTGEILKWDGTEWLPGADDNTTYTAGAGIAISGGNQVSNTGDTNAADDITNITPAGGDLSGTYPNPSVTALQGNSVATAAPSTGEVLKWNGTQWAPAADSGATYTAGTGIAISGGNVISNAGDTNAADDITTSTAAGGDLTGTYPSPTVIAVNNQPFSNAAPTAGQVLKWNGSQWAAATDAGASYTAGTGITISGTTISNSGDTNAADDITTSTAAGGDLIGTYPSPTVAQIQGNPVSSTTPTSGQILKWSGTQWVPGADDNDTYTAGSGISISGNVITNSGDADGSDDITSGSAAGGDLSGTYPNPTVSAITGRAVANTAPATNDVLKWNGTQWAPAADDDTDGDDDASNELQTISVSGSVLTLSNGGGSVNLPPTLTGGTGIAISSNTIINTGDIDDSDDITTSTAAGGDLSGTYPNPTVSQIQGVAVSNTVPSTTGQVMKWNGTQWAPGSDAIDDADADASNEIQQLSISGNQLSLSNGGGTVTIAGSGLYFPGAGLDTLAGGATFINTGDRDSTDDITNTTAAGGDLSGTYPDPVVAQIQGNAVSSATPTSNQVLKWNGSQWAPSADDVNTYAAGSGLNLSANTFSLSNTSVTSGSYGSSTEVPVVTVDAQGRLTSVTTTTITDNNTTYSAGTGINITGGNVIENTGDTDDTDDITTSTSAGGDLSGTYPSPTVAALQGNPVSNLAPSSGQVLKWTGTQWSPADDDTSAYTAGTGLNLSSNEFSLNNTGVTAGIYGSNTVTPIMTVDAQGRISGITTVPITGTAYEAGTGISISNDTIYNTGDPSAADDITNTTSAGGDLSGTYPDPTVAQIQGNPVATTAPSAGQVLEWDGTQWAPATDDGTLYTAGPGINIAGTEIQNIGDRDSTNDITNTTSAGGDLSGTYPDPTVAQIQGNPVATTAPSAGQVLEWDGTQWAPGTDDGTTYTAGTGLNLSSNEFSLNNTGVTAATYGSSTEIPVFTVDAQGRISSVTNTTVAGYTAGTGISISGTTITNIGDTNPGDDLTTASTAGGDASGAFASLTVTGIRGTNVSTTTPATDNVLTFDGTDWTPAALSVTALAVDGDMIPDTDDTYDLGSSTNRYNDVFAANGVTTTSDIRMKKDIEPIAYGITEIMKLNPVSFSWIKNDEGRRKLGLIAQELAPVIKEVVLSHETRMNPETGEAEVVELETYGVNYSDLIPVLIKGMQEQQNQIEKQNELLEMQMELIESLEHRLEQLEANEAEKQHKDE